MRYWPGCTQDQKWITEFMDELRRFKECTCGGDVDQPTSHHDISCPLTLTSGNRKSEV